MSAAKTLHGLTDILLGDETSLHLQADDLASMADWDQYNDSGQVQKAFVTAAEKNRSILHLIVAGTTSSEDLRRYIFILNVLFLHLPKAKSLSFQFEFAERDVDDWREAYRLALRDTVNFESISIITRYDDVNAIEDGEDSGLDLTIFEYHNRLQEITVDIVGRYTLADMATSFADMPHLRRISFDCSWIRDTPFDKASQESARLNQVTLIPNLLQLSSLHHLKLDHVEFRNEEVVESFCRGFQHCSIEELDMNFDCGTLEWYETIVEAIVSSTKTLRSLTLAKTMEEFKVYLPIGQLSRRNINLSSLKMTGFYITREQRTIFCSELDSKDCRLAEITIRGHLTEFDLKSIASSLPHNNSLQRLSLGLPKSEPNNSWIEAIRQSIDLIRQAPALEWLDLHVVDGIKRTTTTDFMDVEACRQVIDALLHKFTLQRITIAYVTKDCQETLDTLARLNRAGRGYLASSKSKKQGVAVLGIVSNRLNDLFTHLRENPSLCARKGNRDQTSRVVKKPRVTYS